MGTNVLSGGVFYLHSVDTSILNDRGDIVNIHGGVFYLHDVNRFSDIEGNLIHNLSPLFTPWQIEAWKTRCVRDDEGHQRLTDLRGRNVDFYYLSPGMSIDTDTETYEQLLTHIRCYPDDY